MRPGMGGGTWAPQTITPLRNTAPAFNVGAAADVAGAVADVEVVTR